MPFSEPDSHPIIFGALAPVVQNSISAQMLVLGGPQCAYIFYPLVMHLARANKPNSTPDHNVTKSLAQMSMSTPDHLNRKGKIISQKLINPKMTRS
jgi:hypothetical protein